MTEVMNTCDSVGGASGEEALALQVFTGCVECFPKLSGCLPSIVVESADSGEVESGELCWPPDDVNSDVREGHTQVTANQCGVLCDKGRDEANAPADPPPIK